MKGISQCFLAWFIAGAAVAQPTQVVVPNGLATVEGNSSTSEPFTSQSFRFQQVFDASQFAFLGTTNIARIDGISFRIDGASTQNVSMSFGGSAAVLSTTPRSPDSLSPVFADNRGLDAVTVWNGGLAVGGVARPGVMPQDWPFAGTIPTTAAFYYAPTMGNLILELAGVDGLAFRPGAMDGQSTMGDSISWVFANSNLTPSGTPSTFGLVTRFDVTVIPEPTISALALIGLALLTILKRR